MFIEKAQLSNKKAKVFVQASGTCVKLGGLAPKPQPINYSLSGGIFTQVQWQCLRETKKFLGY